MLLVDMVSGEWHFLNYRCYLLSVSSPNKRNKQTPLYLLYEDMNPSSKVIIL